MQEETFVFPKLESIEHLADEYLEFDTIAQMRKRNGMERQMYIDYWVVNQFLNENESFREIDEENMGLTEACLDRATGICADHYRMPKDRLVEAFRRITSLDFYDPERKAQIEREWAELQAKE